MSNDFYVYRLDRPWNGIPCYIGKGRGRRAVKHNYMSMRHPNKHLASIYRKAGGPLIIAYVAEGLTEDEAFALEIKLIAEIGCKDQGKGPLANRTDGGEGPTNPPAEIREKMSAARSARMTSEERARLSATMTPEKRAEYSERAKAAVTDETRRKLSFRKGVPNSAAHNDNIRASWTPERRAATGEQSRGRKCSPEARAKQSAARKLYWQRKREAENASF